MSEDVVSGEGAPAQAAPTAGSLLREARQASGMHIAALAVSLKVPVSKLEALEADNHAALRDTVFVRALASSVCRTLKIDPAPVLALLPQSQSPRLASHGAGLNAPVRSSAGRLAGSSSASSASASLSPGTASRSVMLVVLALLVGALVMFVYPRGPLGRGDAPAVQLMDAAPQGAGGAGGASAADGAVATPAAAEPAPAGAPGGAPADGAPAPGVASAAAPPAAATASAAAPGAAPAAADAAAAANANAAAAPEGTLVLRARSQSWVQVRDAAGAVVLQRNLAGGETVSIGAAPPLSVVVGRADATEVFVRGKPMDLSGVSRENVARFEVK